MEQMVNNSYSSQFQGQFQQNMFQSPMLPQHHSPRSPMSSYRQAPYPSPHNPNFRPMHGRAYSTAESPSQDGESTSAAGQSLDHRRLSTPAAIQPSSTSINTDGAMSDQKYMRQAQSATLLNGNFPPLWQDMGPFTTALPPETQQMLGPALDNNDPFHAMLMNGSDAYTNNPYYPWNDMSQGIKGMPVHPSAYHGMSATLAPAAMALKSEATTPGTSAGTTSDTTAPSSGLDFNFSQESKGLHLHSLPTMDQNNSGLGSGQVTPGDAFWDNFVQDDHWSQEASS